MKGERNAVVIVFLSSHSIIIGAAYLYCDNVLRIIFLCALRAFCARSRGKLVLELACLSNVC